MYFVFEKNSGGFLVKIGYVKQKTEDVVEDRLKKIIDLIKDNKDISASQIAKVLDISSRTVQRDIDRLKKQKKLQRVGPEKGGHWQIIENQLKLNVSKI